MARRNPTRTRTVWLTLIASMTGVGGLLWTLDGAPVPRTDGWSLPALVASAGPNSIESILQTRAPLNTTSWTSIVVHHSGAPVGSPAQLDEKARQLNLNGLGYHFVIGNGRGIADGELHVGYRWLDQTPGAHVAGSDADELNRHGIGICLIGDGNRQPFTPAQMRRLSQLVALLSRELNIAPERVVLHSDVAPVEDPGRLFPAAEFLELTRSVR